MTAIEIKVEMASAILNDIDEIRLTEMKKVFNKLYKTRLPEPCVYSVEELRESLIEVERDFAEGKGIPHEEVMAEYGLESYFT